MRILQINPANMTRPKAIAKSVFQLRQRRIRRRTLEGGVLKRGDFSCFKGAKARLLKTEAGINIDFKRGYPVSKQPSDMRWRLH